jgi:hypothetical protein
VSGAGRWPANVILDDEAAALLDAQSGERKGSKPGTIYKTPRRANPIYNGGGVHDGVELQREFGYGDTGGASRFYQRANSRAEVLEWLTKLITPPGGRVLYLWIDPGSAHPGAPTP